MSRIGKQPIQLPEGVTASIAAQVVTVKGPKGELTYTMHQNIQAEVKDKALIVSVAKSSKDVSALWGTTRANLASAVKGVVEGFQKKLELQGVGYRANVKGQNLELQVGFSHPVLVKAPPGIAFTVEKEVITVAGISKQAVGQVAAEVRAVRKPEPYQGKGIRYVGEIVRRKVGKVVGATTS